jgi:hypothetical protein
VLAGIVQNLPVHIPIIRSGKHHYEPGGIAGREDTLQVCGVPGLHPAGDFFFTYVGTDHSDPRASIQQMSDLPRRDPACADHQTRTIR